MKGRREMNRYGARAQEYWQTFLPQEYATIDDPETHFTELGERMGSEITSLALAIQGDDPADEGYLEKLGRLNMARLQAEEQVIRETFPPSDEEQIDQ
jgi:hypothetical protein